MPDNFELIAQAAKKQGVSNFDSININHPKNPYTQEVYQANDLYRLRHNLQIKLDEKDNFFESDLYKDNEKLRNIKFYDVEQLDKIII